MERLVAQNRFTIASRQPSFRIEPRPDLVPLNRAAAKAMDFLRTQGIAVDRGPNQCVRPKWGAQILTLNHVPSSKCIASFQDNAGWRLDEKVFKECLPDVNWQSVLVFFNS